ncbi:MAG: hypothetical protein KF784_01605 [Fimbriimonadaceae bacterium]|nr:hypothetical protein [Fimbriimonadaceae bacterium]
MDPGTVFITAMGFFIFGGIALAVYAYCLHQIGMTLAHRQKWQGEVWRAASRIYFWCLPILGLGFFFSVSTVLQIGISVIAYILHAHPLSVGYWSERERIESAAKLRFRKNVDDWLGEWECQETNTREEL